MLARLTRRLLLAVPTLLGLTLCVFLLVSFSPGGVSGGIAAAGAGDSGSVVSGVPEYLRDRYALDRPVLVQYAVWLERISPVKLGRCDDLDGGITIIPGVLRVAWPDLGWSFGRGAPVLRLIAERLPVTLLISALSLAVIYAVAVPLGVWAASRRGTWIDRALGGLFSALWSMPVACAGVLLIGFLASNRRLGWFPASGLHSPGSSDWTFLPGVGSGGIWTHGWALDIAWHLALPVVCQSYLGIAVVARLVRASVLDNLGSLFVRAARAKGLPERDVLVHHALRAGLLPLITVLGSVIPAMFSGSVVIERVFSIPGIGSLMVEAVTLRDRELLVGDVLVIGVVTVASLLLVDVLYALADPRVRRA